MYFDLTAAIDILSRTPSVLNTLLQGLSDEWLQSNEGDSTWSPYDILGHLIHGEKTDWIPRASLILSDVQDKTFVPFDRFAQMEGDQNRPIAGLLEEFQQLREGNIAALKELPINETTLNNQGNHPELGTVKLKELLSTWVVHDLGHISQITRVMAKQYTSEVGPWSAYLGILKG